MKETLQTAGKLTTNLGKSSRVTFERVMNEVQQHMNWNCRPAHLARAIIEGVLESTVVSKLHVASSEEELKAHIRDWMNQGYKPRKKPRPKPLRKVFRQLELTEAIERNGDSDE